jgi:hypothetical protein
MQREDGKEAPENEPEDEAGILCPTGLPPVALVRLECSDTGSFVSKQSGLMEHQILTDASCANPSAVSLSMVGSSQVASILPSTIMATNLCHCDDHTSYYYVLTVPSVNAMLICCLSPL